jgi:hypothetical protein
MNTAAENPTATPPPTIKITRLADVMDLHRQPVKATVLAYGKLLEFEGRRLLPSESAEIKNLLGLAIPPRNEKGEYNFDDPDYKRSSKDYQLQARAKAVFTVFRDLFAPEAEAQKAEVTDLGKLTAFMQSLPLADDALDALYTAAVSEPVSLVELTGFTSGNSSPKS